MTGFKKRLFTVSAIAMLCACGGATFLDKPATAPTIKQHAAKEQQRSVKYTTVSGHYLSASLAKQQGASRKALDYLNEAIGLGQPHKDLYLDAYSLALSAGDVDLASHFASKIENRSDNVVLSPALVQAVVAIKAGQYEKAEELLLKAPEQGFGHIVVSLLESWVNLALNKPVPMDKLTALAKQGGEFELLMKYQLALIFDAMGKENASYYSDLIDMPYLPHHMALSVANHMRKIGDERSLEKLQDRYRGQVGLQLLDGEVKNKLTTADGASEVFYGIASLLVSIDATEIALVPLNISKYLRDDFASVDYVRAQIAEKSGDADKAIKLYKALEKDDAYGLMASLQLAYLYQNTQDAQSALNKIESLLTSYNNNLSIWLAKGDIHRNEQQFDAAVEAYSAAINTIEEKRAEHWPAFYSRAIAYERAGNWSKAEADFLEALRLQPDQPDVLNYLGYSWLIQNRQLSQAKAMIEKAMMARPRDAHIIDSMGWALYRLGEYEKAVTYLERAVDLSPRDATVNEHLGDVYWRMGYKTQARFQWQRALAFNPTEKGQAEGLEGKIHAGLPAADVPKSGVIQAEASHLENDQQRAEVQSDPSKSAQ